MRAPIHALHVGNLLSYGSLAAALAVGAPLLDAARLANVAAGIVVGKLGTAVVSLDELRASAT